MNWKNTAENLLIVLVGVIAGVAIGYYVSVTTAKAMLDNQKEIIVEAIRKETTSILNEFDVDVKKIKNRKGELTIDVKPIIDNQINQKEVKTNIQDTISMPEEKKGWFGRLFSNKNNTKNKSDE
ncbi:hypothetical protein Peternella1_42 [Winogradskyella phage Peternella_1]|uniref:Uncharacterized protein n=1 Tax=Winogradskyella phage Peternella_1 TaxID=2745699 RepID=A0A8E4ZKA8_9CAUD|nr:hypothetical protein M1M32_gp42 [Winogradskyella phage Peternella_1]QQV91578.1 hypothetical protein Peternella1_42 [Winogradskyella phage Peternella_1]